MQKSECRVYSNICILQLNDIKQLKFFGFSEWKLWQTLKDGNQLWKKCYKIFRIVTIVVFLSDCEVFSVSKIPISENCGSDESPEIEGCAEPGGHDLDPHRAGVGLVLAQVGRGAKKGANDLKSLNGSVLILEQCSANYFVREPHLELKFSAGLSSLLSQNFPY